MKKLLMALTFLAISIPAYCANESFLVPSDVNGVSDVSLRAAGVNNVVIVTSTNAALATDADGNTIADGFVHWIVIPASSTVADATGPFVVLRATNTANLTSGHLIPPVWAIENGVGSGAQSQIMRFDPPMPFYEGLSVNIGPAGITPGANHRFSVGVRHRRKN